MRERKMGNLKFWNPPMATVAADGDEMTVRGNNVRVDWICLGEGHCGDYSAGDPDDRPLLRFDGYRWDGSGWRAVEDFSYCTCVPADTPDDVKARLLAAIHARLSEALSDKCPPWTTVKREGEVLSWIRPEDVNGAYAMTPPLMKADVRSPMVLAPWRCP